MLARKVFASASLLICLSSTALAMDIRHENPYLHNAGWDMESLKAQTEGAVYLRARIKKLEQENEQLRNTLSKMSRSGSASAYNPNDPRVQALIEENKRLSALLLDQRSKTTGDVSVDSRVQALVEENARLSKLLASKPDYPTQSISVSAYKEKIEDLETENLRLQQSLSKLATQTQASSSSADQQVLAEYKQENTRLKEALAKKAAFQADQTEILGLKDQIKRLESEKNELLVKQASLKAESAIKVDQAAIDRKEQEILKLETSLKEMQGENRTLAQALADSSSKLLTMNEAVSNAKNKQDAGAKNVVAMQAKLKLLKAQNEALNQKLNEKSKAIPLDESVKEELASLKAQNKTLAQKLSQKSKTVSLDDSARQELASLKAQNKALSQKLSERSKAAPVDESVKEELASLKAQNISLRETIRAQTDTLKSTDNASQAAERMITENTVLKRKLEQAQETIDSNAKTAEELFARNQVLQKEVMQRDHYIKNVMGASTESIKTKDISQEQIDILQGKNKALEKALEKERRSIFAYRSKIREYQEQIASIQNGVEPASGNDQKSDEALEKKMTALQLENQELKARLQLLAEQQNSQTEQLLPESADLLNKEPESASVEYFRGETKSIKLTPPKGQLSFIDTAYPPVDKVTPLLDQEGQHRFDKTSQ